MPFDFFMDRERMYVRILDGVVCLAAADRVFFSVVHR